MPLLEVVDVQKRFGGLRAVAGTSLTVEAGEIVGLIGPNGAGKTTLFHLISGFLTPDAGGVRFSGEPTLGLRPHALCQRGLARTFQIVKPFHGLTVLENVRVGALARTPGFAEATARAREVIAFAGLEAKTDQLARALTLAERKRLELARALATEPRLLLLDEVMAGLTVGEAQEMVEILGVLRREFSLTLLVIEHVMKVVMTMCDRIVVLDHGEKLAEGTPAMVAGHRAVIDAYLGVASA